MAVSKGQKAHHTSRSGNILLVQIHQTRDPKKAGAKIAVYKFCDNTFSGCCTSKAAAHILGRSVLGQAKAGIQACIAINKKDDDRRAILKNAQRALGEVVRWKEDAAAGKKRKQAVMHELLTPFAKTSAGLSSQKAGSKELDTKIACYFCENGIAFNTAASGVVPGPVRLTAAAANARNYRIAESPNRRDAHFDRIANREALPRDWARFRQPWRAGQSPAAGPALAAGPERLKEGCTRRHSVRERQPALLSSPLEEEPRAAQHLAD